MVDWSRLVGYADHVPKIASLLVILLLLLMKPIGGNFAPNFLRVGDDNGGLSNSGGRQDSAALEDVDDGAAAGADVASAAVGIGLAEADGAKVGKRHQGAVILLEILHDPLGVDHLQGLGLGGEGVGDLSTLGLVPDGGLAGGVGGCLDRDGDGVAHAEGDAREGVTFFRRHPLVSCGLACIVQEGGGGLLTHSQGTTRTKRRRQLGPCKCKSPTRSARWSWWRCRHQCRPKPRQHTAKTPVSTREGFEKVGRELRKCLTSVVELPPVGIVGEGTTKVPVTAEYPVPTKMEPAQFCEYTLLMAPFFTCGWPSHSIAVPSSTSVPLLEVGGLRSEDWRLLRAASRAALRCQRALVKRAAEAKSAARRKMESVENCMLASFCSSFFGLLDLYIVFDLGAAENRRWSARFVVKVMYWKTAKASKRTVEGAGTVCKGCLMMMEDRITVSQLENSRNIYRFHLPPTTGPIGRYPALWDKPNESDVV